MREKEESDIVIIKIDIILSLLLYNQSSLRSEENARGI